MPHGNRARRFAADERLGKRVTGADLRALELPWAGAWWHVTMGQVSGLCVERGRVRTNGSTHGQQAEGALPRSHER